MEDDLIHPPRKRKKTKSFPIAPEKITSPRDFSDYILSTKLEIYFCEKLFRAETNIQNHFLPHRSSKLYTKEEFKSERTYSLPNRPITRLTSFNGITQNKEPKPRKFLIFRGN